MMMSGKDKGKKGKILAVFPSQDKIVIEGLNLIKKAVRARKQGQKGQIIHKERSVNAASAALICGACSKPTRIGLRLDNGNKVRICKKCNAEIK
ncbi:MAG: Ribosomal protein L24 [Candidatus Yanofskybacteria bacterium GW2011_GWA1_44_21]|nr:MAG: Ribosomal protein L24 [Candidatus Yanofskybacteria bacterium GW2011_GWA2_44_10]KKT50698.1 MAG: Ribosomal protein L24 [Candidatus Yanofskybacteria bacterium GW2011_GWA1_44_21]KKT90226.1 MAG: Ribosomal protein L24 [Candidatus Yanofskybacteria bacterium GW2011_GWB1_45_11]